MVLLPLKRLASSSSDDDLVAACLEGSEEAWDLLVDKYKKLVYSVPLKYRLQPEDAADIFQAVWLDLYSELNRLRNVRALGSWLISTAAHKCYRLKRERQAVLDVPASEWEPVDTNPSFLALKVKSEREQMLRDALLHLPGRCRSMVEMLFFQEPRVAYTEVASQLGLAVGSIGFIRGRCLAKLRRILEEIGF